MATGTRSEFVPFVDLVAPHRELEEELVAVFREALRSAEFIGGRQVEAFEKEFASYCGTSECVGVANGTDALRLALTACGVGQGDAVVTVANTFAATVEAITMAGAATEFVDIDERTFNMCPQALASFLDSCERDPANGCPISLRTGRPIKAIVPVHLYGQMADMEPILAVANCYGLVVVEDACQAHGAKYRLDDGTWRKAGSIGRAAAFSFYPSKNLGACGDAGAVTTDDAEVARIVKMLRDHGQSEKYVHDLQGGNSRLDSIQAGLLRVKLRHLNRANEERRWAAGHYSFLLGDVPAIAAPSELERSPSVYHLYVVRHPRRDALASYLRSNGVAAGLHYPVPLHRQPAYRSSNMDVRLETTERTATESLSLPLFPGLTTEQQQYVVELLRAFPGVAAA